MPEHSGTSMGGSIPTRWPPGRAWKDGWLRVSFWALNGGLLAMCVLSLLPVGLMQTWASVEHGYWYARSSEFMQTDLMYNPCAGCACPETRWFSWEPLPSWCSSPD